MTDLELKQGLSLYTDRALQRQETVKMGVMHELSTGKARRRRPGRLLAAAASVAVILSLLAFTPSGRSLARSIGENLSALWETLFPPKELPVLPGGMEERPLHTPQVEDSASHIGFVLYADESRYTASWEGERYIIRPIPAAYTQEDAERDNAALLEGLFLHAGNGTAWDAEQVDCHFVDDGKGGTYRICSYLYTEAIEGHGTRFDAMIATFQVLKTPDPAS